MNDRLHDAPASRQRIEEQTELVGKWEDARRVPDQKRLTWFYSCQITTLTLAQPRWASGLLIFYSFDNCQFPECLAGKILEFSHGSTSLFVEWNVDIDERRRLDSVSMPQRSGGS